MLVLASASPRRIELLRQCGFDPVVDPAHLDETPDPSLPAEDDAARLARGKAELVARRHPTATVVGADTIVVVDGELFGKPRDEGDARRMIERLSGRGHFVVTAVYFIPPRGVDWPPTSLRVSTAVMFRALAANEIDRYVAGREWADKAGGYAIQGLAASFVQAIAGSYTNVVGLPLAEVVEELKHFGELGGESGQSSSPGSARGEPPGSVRGERSRTTQSCVLAPFDFAQGKRGLGELDSPGGRAPVIAKRLGEVYAAMEQAAREAGRDPNTVRLVAVSKLQSIEAVALAHAAGQRDFGENYAQELRDKARAPLPGVRWHFIGPLQRNKVKYVVGVAALIHSIDGASLIDEVARRAATLGVVQRCLLQVNIAGEPQKSGCAIAEVPSLIDAFIAAPSLALEGLMCIPPAATPDDARPHFGALRAIAASERARTGLALPELSMGMSADFAIAIKEGATLVRVGSAIFGERPSR